MGVDSLVIGSIDSDYPGDQWHWILSVIVTAARAYGLQAIDGPYTDIKNVDGYRKLCRRARLIGYDGKWVLHPDQVGIANEVFAPSQEQFEEAPRPARRLPACHRGGAQGRRHVSGTDDRRGLEEDRRVDRRSRRGGRTRAAGGSLVSWCYRGADRRTARGRRPGAPVHGGADPARGVAARARRRIPRRDRGGAEGARHLRIHDPGGVRRPGPRPHHLRARRCRSWRAAGCRSRGSSTRTSSSPRC